MGVLETLGAIDDSFKKNVSKPLLDNDTFSVQDTVRGGIEMATGAGEGGKDDFARDSSQFFKGVNHAIATPGREFGKATQGTAIDNKFVRGAGKGGEALYELVVEDTGAIAYGTVTGADVGTNNPDHAAAGYMPGLAEAAEVGFLATGGTGKVATSGVKALAKGGAKKASGKSGMGILSKAVDGVSSITRTARRTQADELDDAAKAGDDAVDARRTMNSQYKNKPSKKPEKLDKPDHQKRSTAFGSVKDAARSASKSRLNQAAVGGAIGLGALGLAGAPPFPEGYDRVKTYDAAPGATLVREQDTAENILGYWLVLDSNGGDHTILLPNQRTTTVDFPSSRSAPYSSRQQADVAFNKYAENYRDPETSGPTTDNSRNNTTKNGEWGEVSVLKQLGGGLYLMEQEHSTKQEYRYIIAGTDSNGRTLFLTGSGKTGYEPYAFATQEKAMTAYQNWRSTGAGPRPDTSQDRPSTADIAEKTRSRTVGGSGALSSIALAGGAAIAIAVILWRFL